MTERASKKSSDSSHPRVSVVIPAMNSEKFIREAIESVLGQSYPNVECIVVDDGSTDATREIAGSFDGVICLRQDNLERSAARNRGIDISSGAYISFLDSDDLLTPDKIGDQVAFLEERRGYDAVYSKAAYFRGEKENGTFAVKRQTSEGDILENLLYGNFITVNSPLFRKTAAVRVNGFNTSLARNEDWDFFLRLAISGVKFGFIDKCHALCRQHDSNTSRDALGMHEAKWKVIKDFVSENRNRLEERRIGFAAPLALHEADYGKALILEGEIAKGRRHIFNACRTRFPKRGRYFMLGAVSLLHFSGSGQPETKAR